MELGRSLLGTKKACSLLDATQARANMLSNTSMRAGGRAHCLHDFDVNIDGVDCQVFAYLLCAPFKGYFGCARATSPRKWRF